MRPVMIAPCPVDAVGPNVGGSYDAIVGERDERVCVRQLWRGDSRGLPGPVGRGPSLMMIFTSLSAPPSLKVKGWH